MDDEIHSAHPATFSAAPGGAASAFLLDTISRATSPGLIYADGRTVDEDDMKRYRSRTFSYFQLMPFDVEEETQRDEALTGILRNLYIALKAEDFAPGALHWTRELQGWLNLKFEMTRSLRARLAKLYYHLSLAPGLDNNTADRFARMVISLTKKKHYLKTGEDLILDWRPLWDEIKAVVLPSEGAPHQSSRRRSTKHLLKLAMHANSYFDPLERKPMIEEFLPFFSTSELSNAFIAIGALNIMLPTAPTPRSEPLSQPAEFLPTFFHLWSLMSRSKTSDVAFIDLFSRLSRDFLGHDDVDFSEYGVFTKEQSDLIWTTILRLTEIPVGQATSPYSTLDYNSGWGGFLEKDKKKYPVPYTIARWIVHTLSPLCLPSADSVLSNLEGLMQSIDTFFHPSNQGSWTSFLAQLTYYLTDLFVSRWNREQSGELDVPEARRLNPELKARFVLALREVTFVGLFAKSSKVISYYYSTLQGLSYLEPDLMLPGALQRFYPSLQGLVEVHRTTSSLGGLQMIANTLCREKGFRCHVMALLALALPGIDANDLNKTQYTLHFIQTVAYSIPFVPLVKDEDDVHDTTIAMAWVQGEMERMEREGQDVRINYKEELTDEDEANILRSSTAGLGEFVLALLGKVFTLLDNLPDASALKSGSPEDSVINTLPAALTPLFASLSPELSDVVLDKLVKFVSSHVVHQARDAMAWICSALCKVNPEKTLKVFIPILIVSIRNEIDYNGAGSDRSSGTEILPRDRALVWHVSMLSMCVVHVGAEVLKYKDELFQIAIHMQQKCRGLPTIHISNYIHHLLLNLSSTYPIDNALYEPDVVKRGLGVSDWGRITAPSELTIRWHRPSPAEILFAVELFESQAKGAAQRLERLMSDDPPVSRRGKNKEWSDELSRGLTAIRLAVSGISTLFDPRRVSGDKTAPVNGANGTVEKADGDGDAVMEEDDDPLAEVADDDELVRHIHYPAGYILDPQDPTYTRIHDTRDDIGRLLSQTHRFLNSHQQDDVACFTSLYAAYRAWITDMGIERSAHPVERLTRFYKSEISPFKISGLRKPYPRPLLIRRADVYQLQRVKYNAVYRKKSDIDKRLLLDLAESCTSVYSDVRRVAQGAQDSSLKVLVGSRTLAIPVVMATLRKALDERDHDRIKGAIYTLLFTTLIRTVLKDWRFAPELMRLFLETAGVDKASIQAITASAMYQLAEFGKKFESMVIYDPDMIESIKPASGNDDCMAAIQRRHDFIAERRAKVEDEKAALGLELTKKAEGVHWKVATRCSIFALNLSLRFDTIAKPDFIALVTEGVNDQHPGLRTNYQAAFSAVCTAVQVRAVYQHDYRNYLLEKDYGDPNKIKMQVAANDPQLTGKFLAQFEKMDGVGYFVDSDFPGWLVWGKTYTAYSAKPDGFYDYDEVESAVRNQIGALLTKDWVKKLFEYMKQEPRDEGLDRFRMQNVMLLIHVFNLMNDGVTSIKFDDVVELTREVFGDGSDKHQHRATAEIVGALMTASANEPLEVRDQSWGFAAPLMLRVIADDLTPDNVQYWMTCLHLVVGSKDPRRAHEIVQGMADFRLDMSSNAAFKDSSRVGLLEFVVNDAGWHFQLEKPILADLLAHLDHPYKSVREAIGRTIATIYRTRYHESFPDVATLLRENREAPSSVGLRTYVPTAEFTATIRDVFVRLEQWRKERPPGLQTPCSYTSGSKTVLVWLDGMLSSQECTQLVPFFAEPLLEQLLHMMDVKEDPELMKLAYHVYRHLPNIPLWTWTKSPAAAESPEQTTKMELDQSSPPAEEDVDKDDYAGTFIRALVRIGLTATSWHQRLRSLVNMQVVYFRRLFLTTVSQRKLLFQGVRSMLADPQLEVRDTAASTLAGMIRCSPAALREPIIAECKVAFEQQLKANPMPKRKPALLRRIGSLERAAAAYANGGGGNSNSSGGEASGAATPTSTVSASNGPEYEKQQAVLLRHAAVLGLGALVEAFPYATPPPRWMPEVLACLATGPASDPGVVGKAAKQVLAEFKKTRQDSWGVDQKYFTSEQLEDLEGVLWKSYFA